MSTVNFCPPLLGQAIELAARADSASPVIWLARELEMATGDKITAAQARRWFDQARLEGRVPRRYLGPLRDILFVALRYAEYRLIQAIAELEAAENAEPEEAPASDPARRDLEFPEESRLPAVRVIVNRR